MIRWFWRGREEKKLFCPFYEFVADSALAVVDMVMDDLNVSTESSLRTRCIIYQSMVLISIWSRKINHWLQCLPEFGGLKHWLSTYILPLLFMFARRSRSSPLDIPVLWSFLPAIHKWKKLHVRYHTLSQQCQQNQNNNIEIHETFEAFYAKLVISELLG